MRLLLVEDEPEMVAALRSALRRHDMVVDHAGTLAEAEMMAEPGIHDAILLDRRLPDGDGLSLIPRLRAAANHAPVIVLTARAGLADRVSGLDTGADDYLGKPFAVEELLARLRAVLRRPVELRHDVVKAGRLVFDIAHREVSIAGVRLDLPRRELLVLEALALRLGRMVQRPALMEAVFGLDDEIQSNALDTHVSRLRRKLSDLDSGVVINGIRGVGYVLQELP